MTKTTAWQQQLTEAVDSLDELCQLLSLDLTNNQLSSLAAQKFPLRVPRAFIARMESGNWQDPLLQQILPIAAENQLTPGYVVDPLIEKKASPLPGLLHKYQGRVLLIMAGACAVNCRYCFRRHFPYNEHSLGKAALEAALQYIAEDTSIQEVILSGGEPLLLKDELLANIYERLSTIPHVTTVRFHTRLPIVIPDRMTLELITALTATRLKTVIVVHSNHPNEIDAAVEQALLTTQRAEITVLNQSVLLKGINDNTTILAQLSQRLFKAGALPYYLHQLDPVSGAAHFQVSNAEALQLMAELRQQLPGYLVPNFVFEQAGAASKLMVE